MKSPRWQTWLLAFLFLALCAGGVDVWLERHAPHRPKAAMSLPAHLIDALETAEVLTSPLIGPTGAPRSASVQTASLVDFESDASVEPFEADGLKALHNAHDNLGQGGVLEIQATQGGRARLSIRVPTTECGFLELAGKVRIYTRQSPAEVLQTLRATRRLPQTYVTLEPSPDLPASPPCVRRTEAAGQPSPHAVALLPEKQAVDIFSFATWQPFSVPVLVPPGTRSLSIHLDVFVPAFILGLDDLVVRTIDPLSTIDPIGRFRFAPGTETTARLRKVIRAGDEDRLSLACLPGTTLVERVRLEEGSRLDLHATLWSMQGFDPADANRELRVRVAGDDGRDVERTFRFAATRDPGWEAASLDLSELGAQVATVSLSTAADESWRDPPYLLIADPCVSCARPANAPIAGVLLITLDALSADHMSSRGYSRATTPALDRISSEGVTFLAATSPSPSTYTSLPALMASSHRRDGWREFAARLGPDTITLPIAFTRGGFLVKPFIADFYFNSFFKGFYDRPFAYAGLTNQTEKIDEWLVQELIAWIHEVKDRRFFGWLHTNQPHGPNRPYPEHDRFRAEPHVAEALRAIEEFRNSHVIEGARTVEEAADQISLQRKQYPVELVKQAEVVLGSLYDGAIHQADALVAAIDAALAAEGLRDKVLFVISADHGWPLAPVIRPDLILPEESLVVPLILRGPGLPAGLKIEPRVSTIDASTSLLTLAGVDVPASFEGIDLRPYLVGKDFGRDRFVAAQSKDHVVGYQAPWKILLRRDVFLQRKIELPAEGVFLFDLSQDPEGARDVVADHADVALELWRRLDDWHFTVPGTFEDVALSNLLIGHFKRAGYLQDRDH